MCLCFFFVVFVLVLFSGCVGLIFYEVLEGQGDVQIWKIYKQQFSELDVWQIDGKVGICVLCDFGSGILFWLQCQGYYDICLFGLFGCGVVCLIGCEGVVSLEVVGQGCYQVEFLEVLLEE